MFAMSCICLALEEVRFLSVFAVSLGLPVMCAAFFLNSYSIKRVFFFSFFFPTFVKRFSGLGGIFIFNYIFPTTSEGGNARQGWLVCLSKAFPQAPVLKSVE